MTSQQALGIADVVHQANVTVDEKGTVAAAATAVIMEPTSAPVSNVTLVVDEHYARVAGDWALRVPGVAALSRS